MSATPRHRSQVAVAAALFVVFGATAYAQPHGHGARGHHHGPRSAQIEQVIAQVKDQLALDTSQQILWDNAIAATMSARQAGQAERENVHAAMRAELAKPEPDLAALAATADGAQENGQALRRQVRGEWLKLYATFSPVQKLVVRDQLVKRMERIERFNARMKERFGGGG